MSKPVMESIVRSDSDWLTKLNSNFEKLFDAPFPIPELDTHSASKYSGCIAVLGGMLFVSDGSTWKEPREQLNSISDLDSGTATLSDLVTALNTLITDMQLKGWMNES